MPTVLLVTLLAAACPVSSVEDLLPGIVGPLTGQHPAWLIDGSSRHWSNAEERVKTLWVFSRKASGSLQITGRRLDGERTVRFQDGVDGHPVDALVIADPWTRSVIPGGATAEIRHAYSFTPNYVIYPNPGCWQFTVRLGTEETRITIEIK
jgi:hypothetical protein